jgi:uncharacterized membrane protein YeaQ/YmgE (transglycosylase-associated protein family)
MNLDTKNIDVSWIQHVLESMGAMGIVGTILIGLLAGVVAKIIMPGKDPGGLILTTLLGIAGSWLATFLGHYFDITIAGELSGFIAAVAGAFLLLLAYRIVFRRQG